MRMRPLGSTGIEVSEITFGTAGLHTAFREEIAVDALSYALSRGVNAIELDLGDEVAVERVAHVLAQHGNPVNILARPLPILPMDLPAPHLMAHHVYPGEQLRSQIENALRMFKMDRLAAVHLHSWCAEWLGEGDWQETLERLKRNGKIASFGISLFDHDIDAAASALTTGSIDSVQLMYNIFDQGAARRLLPFCAQRSAAVIVRSPLYYGMLAAAEQRPAAFGPSDWRREFFFDQHLEETGTRASRLETEFGPSLSEMAVRFSLSPPAVSTVAIGLGSRAHVDAAINAADRGPLSQDAIDALSHHKWLC